MEFETDEQLPPTFEPYVATPLDHSMTPTHLAAFLTFSLDKPFKAIPILEAGVTRLDIVLSEDIIPIPFALAEDYPSPIFRFQANVMPDGIILCFNFHHTAIDGIGIAGIMDALAVCCRDPDAGPEILRTSPLKEQQSRLQIFEAASGLNIKGHYQKQDLPSPCEPTPSSMPYSLTSRKFVLDAEKIAKLRTECATILKNQSNPHASKISSNTTLAAVIWLCTIRANIKTKPTPAPTKSCALLVTEARSKLRPKLPLSYIGNAVILQPVYTPLTAIVSSTTSSNYNTHITPRLDYDDIKLLAELTSSVHNALGSVCDETIRELISAIAASDNWAANPRPNDVIISSLRSFPTYSLDFGPGFGPVRDFDMPERRIPGQAWIMPARYKGQSSPWEVRLTLDPGVMGNIEKDRLMTWLGPREVSKV
ncbi:hypothetical protein LT330_007599 [Penicillium expansum]|nr:hypothetical protein LT330_007599 [Penicillium expansum]